MSRISPAGAPTSRNPGSRPLLPPKPKNPGEFQKLLHATKRPQPREPAPDRPDERRDALVGRDERERETALLEDGDRPKPRAEPSLADLVPDPLSRALAQAAPRFVAASEPAPPPAVLPELEQLIGRLVRRAAWGGDGRKGVARLELGAGPLAGATVLVQADGGELTIDLELPPGAATEEWRSRLEARLRSRGLSLRELTVR